jgi:thioredoxin reductase (NADPH)
MSAQHKVIILGSGPAGLTAAIYSARANLNPVLIRGNLPGGQLTTTTDVENFPGFPDGIMGPELMDLMEKQATRFGCQFIQDWVVEADLKSKPIRLKTQKQDLTCETLIIATGATARMIGLPKEQELLGYGVSTCATCDGAFFRNQEIAVVGGGDSACEEANFLTRFASKVYLIHRRDELRASKIMRERVLKNPKIQPIWDTVVEDLTGDKQSGLQSLHLKNVKTNQVSQLPCTGLFVAIGHTPNTSLFAGQVALHDNGYIATESNSTKTSIEGVFACGDVQDHVYRQAITAAGSGCMAAIEAERWLESIES